MVIREYSHLEELTSLVILSFFLFDLQLTIFPLFFSLNIRIQQVNPSMAMVE